MTPHIQPLGDAALHILFGEGIDVRINRRVHAAFRRLRQAPLPGVVDWVPAYASLTLILDPLAVLHGQVSVAMVQASLPPLLEDLPIDDREGRTVELPVRYGGDTGPDLLRVAQHTGLSVDEVVHRHSSGVYHVYFLGFCPGFAYLGGLDAQLATPRLDTPRVSVPAGSVAIGGAQTAVYPQATPGGWNLIGHCPEPLFDPERDVPCRLAPGDRLRFRPF
ncbi:MAG: 5-oxoprolinase subunit PxpB [Gammaproteobacteria bacterium]|nr:5-oxoprolinase subunit PxpB [Gammaproteobacteria bacterium]